MKAQLDVGLISISPEWFENMCGYGVTGRAVGAGHVQLRYWNPRDYSTHPQRKIDDKPYGGGPGMVMQAEPLMRALAATRQALGAQTRVLCLSPQGRRLSQKDVVLFAKLPALILISGRYEGIDERVLGGDVEEWSVGDFITSGGELPALCLLDAVIRLLPNVLGNEQSTHSESFNDQLLECPQYTRPPVYDDKEVPNVLLSGDHRSIARWRLQQSLGRTWRRRPDLLDKRGMSDAEHKLLDEYIQNSAE